MSHRERLPNRRAQETFQFKYRDGIPMAASVGFYPDGRIGELFLESGLVGTDVRIAMTETAIAVSFALQYGAPIAALRAAMPRTADGKPEGAIGMLLDLLAQSAEGEGKS